MSNAAAPCLMSFTPSLSRIRETGQEEQYFDNLVLKVKNSMYIGELTTCERMDIVVLGDRVPQKSLFVHSFLELVPANNREHRRDTFRIDVYEAVNKDGTWLDSKTQGNPSFDPRDYLVLYGQGKFRLLDVTGDVNVISCLPCLTLSEKVLVLCFDISIASEKSSAEWLRDRKSVV